MLYCLCLRMLAHCVSRRVRRALAFLFHFARRNGPGPMDDERA